MPVHRHPIAVIKTNASVRTLPLDGELIARLKSVYSQVRANDLRLAEIFYCKLFAAAPGIRALFRGDPHEQAGKLMSALDAVVRNFEHPAENAAMLKALGKRHVAYGAKPEHYDLVIELLVESMRDLLGPSVDARGLEEWRTALRLISDQMLAGAAEQEN